MLLVGDLRPVTEGFTTLHWVLIVLGSFFFVLLIVGLVGLCAWLVREMRLNQRQQAFLDAVTHEMKTPLASLRLYLDTLARHDPPPERRRAFVERMQEDVQRLEHTVGQVLAAARAEVRTRAPAEAIDLAGLLRGSVEEVRQRNGLPDEAIRLAPAPAAVVAGHRAELSVVFRNLLENAVKYSDSPVDVRVDVRRVGRDRVAVEIADRGIGIEPARAAQDLPALLPGRPRRAAPGGGPRPRSLRRPPARAAAGRRRPGAQRRASAAAAASWSCSEAPSGACRRRRGSRRAPAARAEGARWRWSCSSRTKPTSPRRSSSTSRRRATRWRGSPRAVPRSTGSPPGRAVDLVILDLMLPEMGGFEVARRVRAAGNYVPILIVTAKDDAQDRVRGIEEGADDYLTKPFSLDELLARVRALLRRRRWDGVAPDAAPVRSDEIGRVTVHFDRFELETPDGKTVRLTTREAGLLRALLDREGGAIERGELLEQVWGLRADTNTRVVDTFVHRLRRYVEPDPSRPRHIVSVRGHGYRLVR